MFHRGCAYDCSEVYLMCVMAVCLSLVRHQNHTRNRFTCFQVFFSFQAQLAMSTNNSFARLHAFQTLLSNQMPKTNQYQRRERHLHKLPALLNSGVLKLGIFESLFFSSHYQSARIFIFVPVLTHWSAVKLVPQTHVCKKG